MPTVARLTFVLALAAAPCVADAAGRTIAYDGFRTGGGGGTYSERQALSRSGAPTARTVGFSPDAGWRGVTTKLVARDADVRELTHPLLPATQPGSLGVPVLDSVRSIRRTLAAPPVARSGVYTLALLIRVHAHPTEGGLATDSPDCFGMAGFTPENRTHGTDRGDSEMGRRGLGLGFHGGELRAFAGGASFTLVENPERDHTYLLMAELAVNSDGPDHLRGFWAGEAEVGLTPAPWNDANGGRGEAVETWSSPSDVGQMEVFFHHGGPRLTAPGGENGADDLVTWDEIRLIDGRAELPIPGERPEDLIDGLPSLPRDGPRLVAYWPFDEREGDTVKDALGRCHAKLLQARFTTEAAHGPSALRFDARPSAGGSDMASIDHRTASQHGLVFRRGDPFTISAWVRGDGRGEFAGLNDIVTKANSGRAQQASYRDVKGFAFRIAAGKLQLDMINAINHPRKDDRLTVAGSEPIPDDGRYHHVAVTYDGSSRAAGVAFYVNGRRDTGRSIDSDREGHALTRPIDVLAPFNIGGRNDDHRDRFRCGFTGDIDEVAVFNYALSDGEVAALFRIGETELGFDMTQLDALFRLARAGKGELSFHGVSWVPVGPGGLRDEPGEFLRQGRLWSLRLGQDGSGVMTK